MRAQRYLYFDWRPVLTVPLENIITARNAKLTPEELQAIVEEARMEHRLRDQEIRVAYTSRLDGCFAFEIVCSGKSYGPGVERAGPVETAIVDRLSVFVADFIKVKRLKHKHDTHQTRRSSFRRQLGSEFFNVPPVPSVRGASSREADLTKADPGRLPSNLDEFGDLYWRTKPSVRSMMKLRQVHTRVPERGFLKIDEDRLNMDPVFKSWLALLVSLLVYISVSALILDIEGVGSLILLAVPLICFLFFVNAYLHVHLVRIPAISLLRLMLRYMIYTNVYANVLRHDVLSRHAGARTYEGSDYGAAEAVIAARIHGASEAMQSQKDLARILLTTGGLIFSLIALLQSPLFA